MMRSIGLLLLTLIVADCGRDSSMAIITSPDQTSWSYHGTGSATFSIPGSVHQVRITADCQTSSEHFVVTGGGVLVDMMLGADHDDHGQTHDHHFEHTCATVAGTVHVACSPGVSWTFVEVR